MVGKLVGNLEKSPSLFAGGLPSARCTDQDDRESWCLIVQDNTEEGIVDLKSAIVMNEAQFPEFIHEKIHPRARCANHFREHLLRHFGKHLLGLGFLAIASEQQKSPSQPFLARIEKLIHQIFLDSD